MRTALVLSYLTLKFTAWSTPVLDAQMTSLTLYIYTLH